MSHHHHDDHGHDQVHHHHHDQELREESGVVTEKEKLAKILDHWVKHNDDHAKNYRQWSDKARSMGLAQVAQCLTQAADMTDDISEIFKEASVAFDRAH